MNKFISLVTFVFLLNITICGRQTRRDEILCTELSYAESELLEWNVPWITTFNKDSSFFTRRDFTVMGNMTEATLYIKTTHSCYIYINGIPTTEIIGKDSIQYRKYNITNCLQKGENAIGLWIAGHRESSLIAARIKIKYKDRLYQHIRTDYRWMTIPVNDSYTIPDFSDWSQPAYKSNLLWNEAFDYISVNN